MDHLAQLDKPSRIRAEFFLDEDDNREYCKISIIGDPSNLLRKVTPEIIARFPKEYDLYRKQSGRPADEVVGGTPLREIPGLERDSIAVLRYNAVRNAEEFVALDEQTVRSIGAGFLIFQRAARNMLDAKEAKQLRALLAERTEPAKRGPGRPRKEPDADQDEQAA